MSNRTSMRSAPDHFVDPVREVRRPGRVETADEDQLGDSHRRGGSGSPWRVLHAWPGRDGRDLVGRLDPLAAGS